MATIAQSVKQDAGTTSTVSLTFGSTPTQGSMLVAFIFYSQYGTARTVSTPSGWTKQDDITYNNDSLAVFTKVAGASEPTNVVWTISATAENCSGSMHEVSGVVAAVDTHNTSTGSNTVAEVAGKMGSFAIAAFGIDGNSTVSSYTSGWSNVITTSNSGFHNHTVASKDPATSTTESVTIVWGSDTTTVASIVTFAQNADVATISSVTTPSGTEVRNINPADSTTIGSKTALSGTDVLYRDSDLFSTVTTPSADSEYYVHPTGLWGPFDTDSGAM